MNDYPKSTVSARINLPLDVLFCREGVYRIWQIDARKRGIWATFNVIRPTKFLRRQKSQIGEDLWQNGSSDFNNKHFWQLASWNWNWFDLRATLIRFDLRCTSCVCNTLWVLNPNSIRGMQKWCRKKNISGGKSSSD